MKNQSDKLSLIFGEWKEVDKYQLVNHFQKTTNMLKRYWDGKHEVPMDFVIKMKELHPNINLNWFIADQGDPFLDEVSISSSKKVTKPNIETSEKENKILQKKITVLEKQVTAIIAGFQEVKSMASIQLGKIRVYA
ncbi:hypothetical protein [Chondrinema litorale]|uniref:hypothetical protein n=1 Tax=Chondrinema litorale TaxID=2994555 RepID=UPI002543C3C1|nr:hypothetical protein [Chondrinema litorale]UZR95300.1 hypothetical protein OQ292_05635 [Chondrinema litorale]